MKIKRKNMLNTKYGIAKIQYDGYYRIISEEEGNFSKMLHRLIYEDYYRIKIPEGYVIHHKNGIKNDNCIYNLQMMSKSEHSSLHRKAMKKKTRRRRKGNI